MLIERDLPVPIDDGLALQADVYRPDTTLSRSGAADKQRTALRLGF